MYSTQNRGKYVFAERFTKTLKNNTYKHETAISKNVYIYKLENRVNDYIDTYHTTIKMMSINIK